MRLSKSLATGVLLACVLSGVVFAAERRSKRRVHPDSAGANPIFVTNPGTPGVSVYPADGSSFGNVPSLITTPNLSSPSGIAVDSAGNMYAANPPANTITVYAAGSGETVATAANTAPTNPTATIAGSSTASIIRSGSRSIRAETFMWRMREASTAAPIASPSTQQAATGTLPRARSLPGPTPASASLGASRLIRLEHLCDQSSHPDGARKRH